MTDNYHLTLISFARKDWRTENRTPISHLAKTGATEMTHA